MSVNNLLSEKVTLNGDALTENACTITSGTDILTVEDGEKGGKTITKETWSRHLEFMLSCIGYAVGFGAFWRFPYICMKNGGGAFLIPYFISLVICGMPLFLLELSLGQFSGLGPTAVWNMCPLFKGVGWSMLMMSGLGTVYAGMVIGWVIYFISNSFVIPLPWADCDHDWNTISCLNRNLVANATNSTWEDKLLQAVNLANVTSVTNFTITKGMTAAEDTWGDKLLQAVNLANVTSVTNVTIPKGMTAAEEFWSHNVLEISSGIEEMGGVRWPLFACLLATWVVVFLCLFKGIKWSGKVVYVTATLPYIFLTVLLVRGAMLPGALQGIIFYLKPDFQQLKNPTVWAEACLQIFYSLGPTWGGLIAMSRYNKFNNNCIRDTVVICLVCAGTSFYSGFICFSILGYMAQKINLPIKEVIVPGPGLVFSVYPEAIAQLPLSPVWAIAFFVMLLTLGIDSLFGMVESVTSGFVDEFPGVFKFRKTRLIGCLCLIAFLLGIPLTTRAGMFIFQLFDMYTASYTAIIIAFVECLVVGHIYGASQMYKDIEMMVGRKPAAWWRICWCYVIPAIMLALLLYNVSHTEPPKYGAYKYPWWSLFIGMAIATCSILPIPLYAAFRIATEKGDVLTRIKVLMRAPADLLPNKTTTEVDLMTKF